MKFICLPGGFGNAKTFKIQLGPFCKELERDGTASFVFTQGSFSCSPPAAYEGYFGLGPHYRFTEPSNAAVGEVLEAIREFPDAETPEEAMRALLDNMADGGLQYSNVGNALDIIYATMDLEGDVEGIIGFSEGSMIAASVILEEQRRFLEHGIEPRLKCAVFLSGWPPVSTTDGRFVMCDESEEMINIPTLHVMGATDPMIPGGLTLYNMCNMDNAEMFDHGNGHLVPREKEVLRELGQVVRNLIRNVTTSGDSP
ncbi:Hypothetical protein R9X50_00716400 [Acrodontium crateriforme]|uniref:Serine hydrolase domain-containing protein n=1 Tax=Acrodontium crateriforme TaxID=150365 RepID=A0AAQ3RCL3_9PEZI|nr:Hypothetical protein R9X50_00716400 [Acrodontium crateriforme]